MNQFLKDSLSNPLHYWVVYALLTVVIVIVTTVVTNVIPGKWIRELFSRRDGRKKLLADAREYIQSGSFIENQFVTHDLFIRLKPYLSEACIKQFETSAGGVQTFVMSTGGGYSVPKHTLLSELARIEREWKFV